MLHKNKEKQRHKINYFKITSKTPKSMLQTNYEKHTFAHIAS